MHDFGEVVINTVAALAATSLVHFGVTLKEQPVQARSQPAVVRRVQPVRTRPIAALRQSAAPCPNDERA